MYFKKWKVYLSTSIILGISLISKYIKNIQMKDKQEDFQNVLLLLKKI